MELLCTVIREGFRVREHKCRKASGNMRSVSEPRDVVEEYIHKEREAGRLLGPFQPSALPEVHVNDHKLKPVSQGTKIIGADLNPNGRATPCRYPH